MDSATILIDAMTPDDWNAMRAIYLEGIATGNATFETNPPTWEVWDQKHRPDCRLVARDNGRVVAWAALSPVSSRQVYAGVVENSIYVASTARGQGIGKKLLQTLVEQSEQAGIWTIQAGIFPENKASIALHAACGFRIVGYRERIGQMNGVWRDVLFMERRSTLTGR